MSKTRWSSFSALPHLFFSVPAAFQSFIFHLHLLGDLIYSVLPEAVSNPDEGGRTETPNWEQVFEGSTGQVVNYRRQLCDRGWCVLELLPKVWLHFRIRAVIVEGMQPLTTEAPSWNSPCEFAALASAWSEAYRPSGLRNCSEKQLTVLFPRGPAASVCWSVFGCYICHYIYCLPLRCCTVGHSS